MVIAMKIGAMNNPQRDLYKEIAFIAEQGFDFLDLTIEPGTYPDDIDVSKLKALLKRYELEVIGHTPWNLPIASPYASVRDAAYTEFTKCAAVFRKLGVKLINAHPHMPTDMADAGDILRFNTDFFRRITKDAAKHKARIMMENVKGLFNEIEIIGRMLKDVPGLYLHWDVGHANLGNEGEQRTQAAFSNFSKRIMHLHFSDNNGQEDQHLPLGAGNVNWDFILEVLRKHKYKRTVTLEIHSPDLSFLLFSRDKLRYMMKNG